MKVLAWYRNPSGIENKNTNKYLYPTSIKIKVLIIDTRMLSKKEDTSSILVLTNIDTKNK